MEYNNKSNAERLVELLMRKGLTIATAESCTGGAVSQAITSMPFFSRIAVIVASFDEAYWSVWYILFVDMLNPFRCFTRFTKSNKIA